MKLAFNRNSQNNSRWRDLMPHRVALNAYLLVDDAIHRGVNKTAEKIEKKTGLGKIGTIYLASTIGSSCVITIADKKTIIGALLFPVLSTAISHIYLFLKKEDQKHDVKTIDPDQVLFESLLKLCRFTTFGVGSLALSTLIINAPGALLATMIFFTSSTVLYLASSSNGTLDRAIDKAKQLLKALKEAAAKAKDKAVDALVPKPEPLPQPIEVKN